MALEYGRGRPEGLASDRACETLSAAPLMTEKLYLPPRIGRQKADRASDFLDFLIQDFGGRNVRPYPCESALRVRVEM